VTALVVVVAAALVDGVTTGFQDGANAAGPRRRPYTGAA
jgi:hypothetical protein